VRKPGASWDQLICVLIAAGALGGCSIPFGDGGGSSYQPSEETRRERNRLYQEEQQNMERLRQFDRIGPPSDR
jgi:hypothetical protein